MQLLLHGVSHLLLCLQGKQILKDGIGRATEVEEVLDAADARRFLQHPSQLLSLSSELMQNLAK